MIIKENGLDVAPVALIGGVRNGINYLRNALVRALPGERPKWLVMKMSGIYPARKPRRRLLSVDALMSRDRLLSQEEFEAQVSALREAPWLEGVVLRFEGLQVDLPTAYALRRQVLRLRAAGKRVVVAANDIKGTDYYLASAADEIVLPESAEFSVRGMALSSTFMADALSRFGVRVEKLAIKEFKNALDTFALPAMSDAQRLQYGELLDSMERTFLEDVGAGRGKSSGEVKAWVDQGVSSAQAAKSVGMIDTVAYEDEFLTKQHKGYSVGARFLPGRARPLISKRVAVVSLEGTIIPGRSNRPPVPLPFFGASMAGSETLVAALRAANRDASTAAVVFHVDSGGGSPLASDLIWREVKLLAAKKPVVAVMGSVAASGGYYVLTHANKVMAAPTTLTGSIGVVGGKVVLEEFNAKYGLNPETIKRGRFADLGQSARGYDEEERALLERYMQDVYQRFVARVADGRAMSEERVNEIGRGRVWSGADALELGLVDELGDVAAAVANAKKLAGLHENAPVWNVPAQPRYLLPSQDDPTTLIRAVGPLLNARVLLLHPAQLRVS